MQCSPNVHMQDTRPCLVNTYSSESSMHKPSLGTPMRAPAGSNARLALCKPEPACSPHQGNTPSPITVYSREPRTGDSASQAAAGSPSLTIIDNDSRCRQTGSVRACPGFQAREPGAARVLAQHARSSEAAMWAGALGCQRITGPSPACSGRAHSSPHL